jgi:hypothetical protein
MYILSKHRELLKQINIHEISENFRRNLASNKNTVCGGKGRKRIKIKKKKIHSTQKKKTVLSKHVKEEQTCPQGERLYYTKTEKQSPDMLCLSFL